MKPSTIPTLFFSLGASFLAGAVGSIFTTQNIPLWYAVIAKPPLLPPTWVFAPVWTVLYACMGVALYLVITDTTAQPVKKRLAYWLFGTQLALNTLWSAVFFGWHLLWLACGIIFALILAAIATIIAFRPISKAAGYLLWPYVVWLGFAAYLTVGVALLN